MKIYCFISIVLLLVTLFRRSASIDSDKFISETDEDCKVTNELYWKIIQWFYGPLKFVDVHVLTETNITLSMNQLATFFLKEIADSKFSILIEF